MRNRGITLVALVVTIIVLIILATISIRMVVGEGGLIWQAEKAKDMHEREALKERLNMERAGVAIEKGGDVPIDDFIQRLENQGIIVPGDVEEDEDGNKRVVTPDGWVAEIIPDEDGNVEDVIVEGKAGNLPARITNLKLETTEEGTQITATITVARQEKATYTYSYKEGDKTSSSPYQQVSGAVDVETLTCTITNLEKGRVYTVKVEGKDKETKEVVTSIERSIQTGKVGDAEGAIDIGNQEWNKETHRASVTVTKKESISNSFQIQYQTFKKGMNVELQENNWQIINDGGKIENLDLGEVIYVRLWNGYAGGGTAMHTVNETDAPTVTITNTTKTTNKIRIEVTAEDNEAGMPSNPEYIYKLGNTKGGDEVKTETSNNATHEFTGLTHNTDYYVTVEVKDLAGNLGRAESEVIHTEGVPDAGDAEGNAKEGVITFEEFEWEENTAHVTVRKTSSTEGLKLMYQVIEANGQTVKEEWKEATEGAATITGLKYQEQVRAKLTDGSNEGNTARFTVGDSISPNITISNTSKTTNTISVTITAEDKQSGLASDVKYTYAIGTAKGSYTVKTEEDASLSHTFTDLTNDTDYYIKVEVKDIANNSGSMETQEAIHTTKITEGGDGEGSTTGAITYTGFNWPNKGNTAEVTVNKTTEDSYTMAYQIYANISATSPKENKWTPIESGGKITGLKLGEVVKTALTDGTSYGKTASFTVVDNAKPSDPTVNMPNTTTDTDGSIEATVTLVDNQSGIDYEKSKWAYTDSNTPLTVNGNYDGGSITSENQKITLKKTTGGTYYLHILSVDKAGNKEEYISTGITVNQLSTNITVNPTTKTIKEGETFELTATVTPTGTGGTLSWTTSGAGAVEITGSGVKRTIKGTKAGQVTITVKTADHTTSANNKSAQCTVTIETAHDPKKMEIGTAKNADKYGQKVTNYTEQSSIVGCWRLFYQDDNYTYIISDNLVGSYTLSSYTSNYANGAAVSDEGQSLSPKLKTAGNFFTTTNTYDNIKATAFLTDTSSSSEWNKYKGEDALFAFGSPTVELFLASYNATAATNGKSKVEVGVGTYGYTESTSGNEFMSSFNHGIYNSGSSSYWWLASPRYYSNGVFGVSEGGGYFYSNNVRDTYAVRPLVCIQTSVFNSKYLSSLSNS